MRRMTEARLRTWYRRAQMIDEKARRLMDDVAKEFGFEGEATDRIDNVLHATEDLLAVLARPELEMWKISRGHDE